MKTRTLDLTVGAQFESAFVTGKVVSVSKDGHVKIKFTTPTGISVEKKKLPATIPDESCEASTLPGPA